MIFAIWGLARLGYSSSRSTSSQLLSTLIHTTYVVSAFFYHDLGNAAKPVARAADGVSPRSGKDDVPSGRPDSPDSGECAVFESQRLHAERADNGDLGPHAHEAGDAQVVGPEDDGHDRADDSTSLRPSVQWVFVLLLIVAIGLMNPDSGTLLRG